MICHSLRMVQQLGNGRKHQAREPSIQTREVTSALDRLEHELFLNTDTSNCASSLCLAIAVVCTKYRESSSCAQFLLNVDIYVGNTSTLDESQRSNQYSRRCCSSTSWGVHFPMAQGTHSGCRWIHACDHSLREAGQAGRT